MKKFALLLGSIEQEVSCLVMTTSISNLKDLFMSCGQYRRHD